MNTCETCGAEVKPNQTGSYRQVSGWEKIRAGGGANAIVLRAETGKVMCAGCGERRKLNARWGVVDGQQTLID